MVGFLGLKIKLTNKCEKKVLFNIGDSGIIKYYIGLFVQRRRQSF